MIFAWMVACAVPDDGLAAFAEVAPAHAAIYAADAGSLDEEALHARYAAALDGDALTDAWLAQVGASRAAARQGATLRPLGLRHGEVVAVDADPLGLPRVDLTFYVRGIVAHADHKHVRLREHRALLTLDLTDNGWRIVDLMPREAREVAVRRDDPFLHDVDDADEAGFLDPIELMQATP